MQYALKCRWTRLREHLSSDEIYRCSTCQRMYWRTITVVCSTQLCSGSRARQRPSWWRAAPSCTSHTATCFLIPCFALPLPPCYWEDVQLETPPAVSATGIVPLLSPRSSYIRIARCSLPIWLKPQVLWWGFVLSLSMVRKAWVYINASC